MEFGPPCVIVAMVLTIVRMQDMVDAELRFAPRGVTLLLFFAIWENVLRACPERINNDGNYELANCKWATYSEQRRNQRRMGSTECLHGHLRTPENTGTTKEGKHFCRVCSRLCVQADKKRKKQEKLNAAK